MKRKKERKKKERQKKERKKEEEEIGEIMEKGYIAWNDEKKRRKVLLKKK